MKAADAIDYETWLQRLRTLAINDDKAWLVADQPGAHRAAYDQGLSPEEEFAILADMAQWRGCGCGGGG